LIYFKDNIDTVRKELQMPDLVIGNKDVELMSPFAYIKGTTDE